MGSDQQDTMYGHLIAQTKFIEKTEDRKKSMRSLRLSRARLASQSSFLSKNKRLQRIPDLVHVGERSDLDDLSKLINDPYEEKVVIELAKEIRELLLKRLQSDAGNVNNS